MADSLNGAGSPFEPRASPQRTNDKNLGRSIWDNHHNRPKSQHIYSSSSNTSTNASSPSTSSLYLPFPGQSGNESGSNSGATVPGSPNEGFRSRARAGTLPSRLTPAAPGARPGSTSSLRGVLMVEHPSPIGSPSLSPFKHEVPTAQHGPVTTTPPMGSSSPTASRLRSGSLSILADNRPTFSPFGPSIWANNPQSSANSNGTSSSTNNSTPTTDNRLSQQSLPANEDDLDPMKPFLQELSTMRTDVSRLRSYTVNGGAPFEFEENDEDEMVHPQMLQSQSFRGPQQPQQHHHQQTQQQQSSQLLSNHMMVNRPRAATASGSFDPQLYMRYTSNNTSQLTNSPSLTAGSQFSSYNEYPLDGITGLNSLEESSVGPTRSLYVGNIPPNTNSYTLQAIFSSYGAVDSARVLNHKNCGFINFTTIESAIHARSVLNGKEIFAGSGPCRIGFAKVSTDTRETPSPENLPISEPRDSSENYSNNHNSTSSAELNEKDTSESIVKDTLKPFSELVDEMSAIVGELDGDHNEQVSIMKAVKRAMDFTDFKPDILPVPEPKPDRVYDAPTLREVRKKIDSGSCSQDAIEEIALDMLDEIAELSSDYVGNTVVQKLFDLCSEPIKDIMLTRIAPYLAQIGVHKNGTWAAQKIIDVVGTNRQKDTISRALRPYTPHLFLDQFGNYVIQGCLKFGPPWNDFIFESVVTNFWEISRGRFGSRATRACLESAYVTPTQQRMLAACITLYSVQLATNANGALLLTWLLDTYTSPRRHSILAPRLVKNIVQLCTHKLASLTVLKVINYKLDPSPRQIIFDAIFGNLNDDIPTHTLEQILGDPHHGPTFIYKIISVPLLGPTENQNMINKIKTVLISMKASPNQGYKRLMDEIELSSRVINANSNSNTQNGRSNITSGSYPPMTHNRGKQVQKAQQQQPQQQHQHHSFGLAQQGPILQPQHGFGNSQGSYLSNMNSVQQGVYSPQDSNNRMYGQFSKSYYDMNQNFDQLSLSQGDGPYRYPGSLSSFSNAHLTGQQDIFVPNSKSPIGLNQLHDHTGENFIHQSNGYQQFPGQ